jgi:hypothetical protein
MGIGCEFLCGGDVMGVPGEKKDERGVDEAAEDWWVENMLPHESGGEDGTAAKDEEKESGTNDGSKRVSAGRNEGLMTYEAFMRPSTRGAERPLGRIAGARAMNTFTFWFS